MKYFYLLVFLIAYSSLSANGTCANPIALSCGDAISGNTANGEDNYQEHGGGNSNYTGPELVYEFEAAAGNVTIHMTNLSADLDLYLLDICTDPVAGEIEFSENGGTLNETISLTLTSGGTFYIMVDGFNGNVGTFDLSLSCTPLTTTCPNTLTVNSNPIASNTYRANTSLIATGRVANGSTVNFRAGQNITLSPGFRVENGATFSARIQACPVARFPEGNPNPRSVRVAAAPDIKVYPNPVQDQVTLTIGLDQKASIEMVLLDQLGRPLQVVAPTSQSKGVRKYVLNVSQLVSGWYSLSIQIGNTWYHEKLIKQ
jgi:hypothetical protein